MKILIDADGCPVTKIAINIAKSNNLPAMVVKNHSHVINDDYATVVTVDKSADSADYYIANHCDSGDIVVTQDYGLAAMAIAKSAKCITQNGLVINTFNIDNLLDRRHVNREMRKQHKKYTKHKKRTPDQDEEFRVKLIELVKEAL